jgi:hypothetical protein
VSSLGSEAQKLIESGRSAFRPTVADRERIALALQGRIGAGGAGLSAAPAAKAWGIGASWRAVSTVVVGLAAGGVFVTSALRTRESAPPAPAQMVSPAAPAAALEPEGQVVAPAATSEELPSRVAVRAERAPARDVQVSVQRPSDRLGEEVDILSRAQTALHAAQFTEALRVLDEHARKFPRGKLAQERRATRIQALCALGRTSEAESELARLSPGSVHEIRARQACAAKLARATD